jgi:hypothetical protein
MSGKPIDRRHIDVEGAQPAVGADCGRASVKVPT